MVGKMTFSVTTQPVKTNSDSEAGSAKLDPNSPDITTAGNRRIVTRSKTGSLTPKQFTDSITTTSGTIKTTSKTTSSSGEDMLVINKDGEITRVSRSKAPLTIVSQQQQYFKLGNTQHYRLLLQNIPKTTEEMGTRALVYHPVTASPKTQRRSRVEGSRAHTVLQTLFLSDTIRFNSKIPTLHAPNWALHLDLIDLITYPCFPSTGRNRSLPVQHRQVCQSLGVAPRVRPSRKFLEAKEKEIRKRKGEEEDTWLFLSLTTDVTTLARCYIGLSHSVWKQRGEEYRVTGGVGWLWVRSTRSLRIVPQHSVGLRNVVQKYIARRQKEDSSSETNLLESGVEDKNEKIESTELDKMETSVEEVVPDKINKDSDMGDTPSDKKVSDGENKADSKEDSEKSTLLSGESRAVKHLDFSESSVQPGHQFKTSVGKIISGTSLKFLSRLPPKVEVAQVDVSHALINRTHYPKLSKPYSRLDSLLERRLKQEEFEKKQKLALEQQITWKLKSVSSKNSDDNDSEKQGDGKKTSDSDEKLPKLQPVQYTCYSFLCRNLRLSECYSSVCRYESKMPETDLNESKDIDIESVDIDGDDEDDIDIIGDKNDPDDDSESKSNSTANSVKLDKDDEDMETEISSETPVLKSESNPYTETNVKSESSTHTETPVIESESSISTDKGDVDDENSNESVSSEKSSEQTTLPSIVPGQTTSETDFPDQTETNEAANEKSENRDSDLVPGSSVMTEESEMTVENFEDSRNSGNAVEEKSSLPSNTEKITDNIEVKESETFLTEEAQGSDSVVVEPSCSEGSKSDQNIDLLHPLPQSLNENTSSHTSSSNSNESIPETNQIVADNSKSSSTPLDKNVNSSSRTASQGHTQPAVTSNSSTKTISVSENKIIPSDVSLPSTSKAPVASAGTVGEKKSLLSSPPNTVAQLLTAKASNLTSAQLALRQAIEKMSIDDLRAKMPPARMTRDQIKLMSRFGKFGRRKVVKKSALPTCHKFMNRSKKKNILILEKHELKKLSRKGGNLEVKHFNYNCKMNNVNWPYPCPRPLFKTAWRYRTQTLRTLGASGLQLHILWSCVRWDDLNVKPPAGGTNTVSTETEITTTELLKRRDIPPHNLRSEFLVRKIVVPIGLPAQPKEKYTPQRSGLRERKRAESPKQTEPSVTEKWTAEETLELWEIKQFGEKLEKQRAAIQEKLGQQKVTQDTEKLKAQMEIQLKQQRLAIQQKRLLESQGKTTTVTMTTSTPTIVAISKSTIPSVATVTAAKAAPTLISKSLTPLSTPISIAPGTVIKTVMSSSSGGTIVSSPSSVIKTLTVQPKILVSQGATGSPNLAQIRPGVKVQLPGSATTITIRPTASSTLPTRVLTTSSPATALSSSTRLVSPGQLQTSKGVVQIRPQVVAQGVPGQVQNLQIIQGPSGQLQVRGLVAGQQIIRLPDGRLQLITLPSQTATAQASPASAVTPTSQIQVRPQTSLRTPGTILVNNPVTTPAATVSQPVITQTRLVMPSQATAATSSLAQRLTSVTVPKIATTTSATAQSLITPKIISRPLSSQVSVARPQMVAQSIISSPPSQSAVTPVSMATSPRFTIIQQPSGPQLSVIRPQTSPTTLLTRPITPSPSQTTSAAAAKYAVTPQVVQQGTVDQYLYI
ncbi:hypothetical protein ScPMuIL_004578 [Solemya velum]